MNTQHDQASRTSTKHRLILAAAAIPLLFAVACGSSSTTVAPVATPDASRVATQALIEDVSEAAADLSAALENPDVSSEAWRANAVAALATLSTQVAETTVKLEATGSTTVEQQQLAAATGKYSEAAGVLALGIETQDLDKIDAAATLLGQATASLVAAQVTLNN